MQKFKTTKGRVLQIICTSPILFPQFRDNFNMVYITKADVFYIISRLEKYMLAAQEYRAIYLFSSSSGFVVSPGPIIWLDYINVQIANHNLGFLNCIQLYSFPFPHSTFFFY
jgi:hypothetical protein